MRSHNQRVIMAYVIISRVLLELKAEEYTPDEIADAIVRACYEAGIERIK